MTYIDEWREFFLQKKNIINIEVHAFNDLEHRAEHVLIAVCCIRCVCRWYMLNILCSTFGLYYYVNHIKKTFIFIRSISLWTMVIEHWLIEQWLVKYWVVEHWIIEHCVVEQLCNYLVCTTYYVATMCVYNIYVQISTNHCVKWDDLIPTVTNLLFWK